MRRRAFLIAAVTALACCPVAPARAAGASGQCKTQRGAITFSPTLPKRSNPKKVPTILTIDGTVSNCTLFAPFAGATSGKWRFVAVRSASSNCTTLKRGENFKGKLVFTVNTGKTFTGYLVLNTYTDSWSETASLNGLLVNGHISIAWPADGSCATRGLSKLAYKDDGRLAFLVPGF